MLALTSQALSAAILKTFPLLRSGHGWDPIQLGKRRWQGCCQFLNRVQLALRNPLE
jgi:hypothetical protein